MAFRRRRRVVRRGRGFSRVRRRSSKRRGGGLRGIRIGYRM